MPEVTNKYGVGPKARRTRGFVTYASEAEAIRGDELDLLAWGGHIDGWKRQVSIPLGRDSRTIVDFVVTEHGKPHAEEVKGHETRDFKRIRRLWKKYGPMPLKILKRRGNGWVPELLPAATEPTNA